MDEVLSQLPADANAVHVVAWVKNLFEDKG